MKKSVSIIFVLLYLGVIISLAHADSVPNQQQLDDMQGKIDTGQNIVNGVPIDENGNVNQTKLTGWKSIAEQRIDEINLYVGPFSKAVFGVELSLSLIFILSVIMWILLAEIIISPASQVFNLNTFAAIIMGLILSSLAMHGFGHNFVIWIDSIAQSWYAAVIAIVVGILFAIIYSALISSFGKKMKESKEKAAKEKEERNRKILEVGAETVKKEFES